MTDESERLDNIEAEAEALTAISRAMGPVTPQGRKRVAAWANALADPEANILVTLAKELGTAREAVKRHQDSNSAMTKADALLYVAVFGHEKVGADVLKVLYAPDSPETETGDQS